MRIPSILGTTLTGVVILGSGATPAARAVQFADGTVHFVQVPRLVEAVSTRNVARTWGGTFYFTLDHPEGAGEPLQKVVIRQREGFDDDLKYDLEESRAFEGTRRQRGDEIPLGEVTQDRETQTVVVNFDPPVPPGKTVTLGLRPTRNPYYGGVYLFGVTAFPAGEQAQGQFLGFGRFHFYRNGNGGAN